MRRHLRKHDGFRDTKGGRHVTNQIKTTSRLSPTEETDCPWDREIIPQSCMVCGKQYYDESLYCSEQCRIHALKKHSSYNTGSHPISQYPTYSRLPEHRDVIPRAVIPTLSDALSKEKPPVTPPLSALAGHGNNNRDDCPMPDALPLDLMSVVGFSTRALENCAPTDSGYASLSRDSQYQAKESVPDALDDVEDTATVYSVATSVCRGDIEMYSSQFAEALADLVSSEAPRIAEDAALVQAVGDSLPKLLKAFSLRLGCAGSSKVEKEVMYFTHKHRSAIASRFQTALIHDSQPSDSGSSSKPREKPDLSTVHSFIRSWLDGLGDAGEHHDLCLPTLGIDEDCDALSEAGELSEQNSLPCRYDYTRIVFESVAYRWLTVSLKKLLLLVPVPSQSSLSGRIYSEVIRHLDGCRRTSVSSRRSSYIHTLKLRVDWDPIAFLRKELGTFQGSFGQLLKKTITLTGSATDAEALPCEEYLCQTWPASGPGVLALLVRALDSNDEVEATLPDKTQVNLNLKLGFLVEVRGTPDSIAEVVEQIAWLGAVLRTSGPQISGTAEGLSLCSPTIDLSPSSQEGDSPPTHTLAFRTTPIPNGAGPANPGQCWHRLFRDPCIAVGYPIPRRSKYNTGLEIPLTMMACLAQSPRIHDWFGKYLLKGFSTAIVPQQRSGDMIIWHLYCSDGERLPYPDTDTTQCADLEGNEIAIGRHILGWCSEAHFYAGSKEANYAITESRLNSPGKDFSLEKVSFSVGQIVTGGCQFSIGRKDTPIRISRGGYIDKLRWIRQRYFTLYDVDDNRGFLVDGASTLLHLLRTSFHISSVDEFASEFLFKHSEFQDSPSPLMHNSALKVLLNLSNRKLPLYREDENTCTTVQQRIEQLYETLEKLVDHAHHSEAARKGINAVPRISNHLKGWDFIDLAGDRDPFHLKVTKLPPAVNWTDFTRAIPAVTLFGRGFGELIRPAAHPHVQTQACRDWMALPTSQNLLCVGVSDLRDIVRRIVGGSASTAGSSTLLTLAPGVVCFNAMATGVETFSRCVCERTKAVAAHSRFKEAEALHVVLELASEGGISLFGRAEGASHGIDLESCPDGAVILGTPKWKWPWQNPPALPLGVMDQMQGQSLQIASPVSSSSAISPDSGLDSASGLELSGSATPLTSVASDGSGAGDRNLVRGDGDPMSSGTKRRGWQSSDNGSEESRLSRVESGKRRKMLGKVRETTNDINAFLIHRARNLKPKLR